MPPIPMETAQPIGQIIDRDYGRSNIEHALNGLMPGMDNWIYNGRSLGGIDASMDCGSRNALK